MNNRGRVRYRFRFGVTLAILSILSLLTFSYVGAQSGSGIQLAVDTADTTQDGVLSIFGGVRLGGEVGLPVAAGDINGDGKADVVFCEMYATTGAGLSKNNGQVNIYVSDGRDTGTVDASQNPPSISTIAGRSAGDLLGSAVTIGDVNGDGFGDVVVSASLNDGPDGSRFNAGAVYVIPGSPNFNVHADLSAAGGATPPNGISVIYGPQMNGRFGIWVETGDVDGDGIADIVVGADQLNSGNGMRQQIGGAYIIFGAKDLPQVIDLASPPPGVRITRILGVNPGDHWGAALSVGDIDGDGLSDVMISAAIDRDSASYVTPLDQSSGVGEAAASDGGLRPACGEVYVLYGSKNWPPEIDLSSPPTSATHLIGAHFADFFGSQLFSADLNGDGKRDLIIGSLQALSPDAHGRTGAVYVVYGSSDPTKLQGATIDMLNPPAAFQVSVIYGENNLDCAGDSVRAYDINNDGMAELFIGSPDNNVTVDGVDRDDAGTTDIILGRPDFLPPVVKLYDLPPGFNVYRLAGAHGDAQGLNGGDEFS
ncbi:MAG: VCBS repeat-containing protein, partial [Blastocatellia bacterium]